MAVKIDGVSHRAALVTQELGAVLWCDTTYRVGREAVAKGVDLNRRKTSGAQDDGPCLIEAVEGLRWPTAAEGRRSPCIGRLPSPSVREDLGGNLTDELAGRVDGGVGQPDGSHRGQQVEVPRAAPSSPVCIDNDQ